MHRSAAILLGLAVLVGGPAVHAGGQPWTPTRSDVVLEVLPASTSERGLRLLRAAHRRDPGNLATALLLARRYIELSRIEGDPRPLGYARAVLDRWWQQDEPDVMLVRATLRQSQHEFDPALGDLDSLLRVRPGSAQAWLTKATIEQVQGRYDAALLSCRKLVDVLASAGSPDSLVGHACVAEARGFAGDTTAYRDLVEASSRAGLNDRATSAWLQTLLAEMAERQGLLPQAERHYRQALAMEHSIYRLGAWSDFLLAHRRAAEVITLIGKDEPRRLPDATLLRLALAQAQLGDRAAVEGSRSLLRERFEAARLRGVSLHGREEARFVLALEDDPARALTLALANWSIQKEPADVLVLAEAARRNGRKDVLQTLEEHVKRSGLRDARIDRLLAGN